MAYGLSTRAFIEDGPARPLAEAETARSSERTWRALSHATRLEVVEQALRAANDSIDGYPLAL